MIRETKKLLRSQLASAQADNARLVADVAAARAFAENLQTQIGQSKREHALACRRLANMTDQCAALWALLEALRDTWQTEGTE